MVEQEETLRTFFRTLDSKRKLSYFVVSRSDFVFEREWYSGANDPNAPLCRVRDQKRSRYALKEKKVCYFSVSSGRIDFEIGDYFSDPKNSNRTVDFYTQLWPRMTGTAQSTGRTQEIHGAYKLNNDLRLLNLGDDSAIDQLNQAWNTFVTSQINKDFIRWLLEGPRPDVYLPSGIFADAVYEKEFNGILYRPSTLIGGALGPHDDPMLVLFEPNRGGPLVTYFHSAT